MLVVTVSRHGLVVSGGVILSRVQHYDLARLLEVFQTLDVDSTTRLRAVTGDTTRGHEIFEGRGLRGCCDCIIRRILLMYQAPGNISGVEPS